MVCTLLAGVNVVAFAADDATETVSVSKFYNDAKKGGDGEHLFTKDADEISWLSSLKTWNNEGEAWKAPAVSTEAVYRCYNPNSGEHLYVDEGYADYLAGMGWNKEKVAFYSDDNEGVPVYRLWNGQDGVGSHHFTTDAGEVEWLVGQGWTAEDIAFYGVKEDQKDEVKLVDDNGLQSDGTALNTDTLSITYGADFGIPARIIWYCNGAAKGVYTTEGGSLTRGFNSDDIKANSPNFKLPVGEWYVTVENVAGKVYKTNTLTVVDDEAEAVLSEFSINDNYAALKSTNVGVAATAITLDDETSNAVVTVTLDRDYTSGTFYLVPADLTKYDAAKFTNSFDLETEIANITTTTKKSEFNDLYFAEKVLSVGDKALEYEATDGTVSYKFTADLSQAGTQSVDRGEDYMLVFDQDGTIASTQSSEEWITTDEMTVPYLYAPTSIKVVDVKDSVQTPGWGAQLYMGDMEAGWINDVALTGQTTYVAGGVTDTNLWSNSSAKAENGTQFSTDVTGALIGGKTYGLGLDAKGKPNKETACTNTTDEYVYATWYAPEGIFGEDAIELVSEAVPVAPSVATKVTTEYSIAAPTSITANVENLKADSVAVLTNVKKGGAQGEDLDATNPGTYISIMPIAKGASSVTFDNVVTKISDDASENNYYVVVVPALDDSYSAADSIHGDLGYRTVTQQPASFAVGGTAKGLKVATPAAITATTAKLVMKDQFGKAMKGVPAQVETAGHFVPAIATNPTCNFKFKIDANNTDTTGGVISINSDNGANAKVGDRYYLRLGIGNFLVATCTKEGVNGVAEWTISMEPTEPQ